jgi:tetratricopeptide (TPR) repeat protein
LAYLTRTLHHLGNTREAIELCSQWVEQAKSSASNGYLALLEMDDGNMPRAQELAQQVLARDPENNDAAVVVGTWSVEAQEMEQAERLFEGILHRQPNNPRAWLGLGLVRMYQQKHSEAIPALERAGQLMPRNVGTIVALGWAHLAARDVVNAEKVFHDAVAADHNFAEAHGGLASALALQAKVKEAQTAALVANRLNSANFGAKFAQSVLLTIHGKTGAAQRLLSHVLEHAPTPDSKTLIEHLRLYGARQLKSGHSATPRQPAP